VEGGAGYVGGAGSGAAALTIPLCCGEFGGYRWLQRLMRLVGCPPRKWEGAAQLRTALFLPLNQFNV
jgi:hypothetical protein